MITIPCLFELSFTLQAISVGGRALAKQKLMWVWMLSVPKNEVWYLGLEIWIHKCNTNVIYMVLK